MSRSDRNAAGRRFRPTLIWILAILALTTETVAIVSDYRVLFGFRNSVETLQWEFVVDDGWMAVARIGPSSGGASTISSFEIPFLLLTISYTNSAVYIGLGSFLPDLDGWKLSVNLWPLVALFAAYPIAAVTKDSVTYIRRRRRGLCLRCGYDLTGNVTGTCSECGCRIERT